MHTVLEALCTGCELCIAPCPVDCITIVPRTSLPATASPAPSPAANQRRFQAREARLRHRAGERRRLLASRKRAAAEEAGRAADPEVSPP
jgi:Na+-translocating ferredoxin:NAD+ oxidoreductase subunit B